MMPRALTVTEVAKQLVMSDRYVRRQLEAGALRGRKFGNKWRVTQAAVDEFLDPESATSKPAAPITARQRRAAS